MTGIRQYWQNLSARERWLLGAGLVFAIAVTFYVAVWEPWHAGLRQLRSAVPEKVRTLNWMTQQTEALAPVIARQPNRTREDPTPLLTVIEQAATAMGLRQTIRRMQPGQGGEVQIWIEGVAFDPWLRWIDALGRRGVEVTNAVISRSGENQVSVRLAVERG